MNVGRLRHLLESLDDDAEVRIATQPAWSFEHDVADVLDCAARGGYEVARLAGDEVPLGASEGWYVIPAASDGSSDDAEGPYADEAAAGRHLDAKLGAMPAVVYIVEGEQLGYLPGAAKAALGWR